jgi:hypothetical protein
MPEHSAHCVIFDQIQDNFYIGGAGFNPYDKLLLYVSEDLAGQESPPIDSFSSELDALRRGRSETSAN